MNALVTAADAHIARAATLAGVPVPPRSIPALHALGALPAASGEYAAASRLWWELALTEARVAAGTARAYGNTEDLHQEARIGLYRAAMTYDPALSSFRTHAKQWVRSAVQRAHAADRPVRLGSHALLTVQRGEGPSHAAAVRAWEGAVSLETVAELRAPEADLDRDIDARRVAALVDALPAREAVLVRRHIVEDIAVRTIGAEMGLGRTTAWRAYQRALDVLCVEVA